MKLVGATNWFVACPSCSRGCCRASSVVLLGGAFGCCSSTATGRQASAVSGESGLRASSSPTAIPTWVWFSWSCSAVRRCGRVGHRSVQVLGRVDRHVASLPDGVHADHVRGREHIATITLDRPDQLNAFTGTMMRELIDAFDQADADDDVRVVVITGGGGGSAPGPTCRMGGDTFATAAATGDRRRRAHATAAAW